MATATFGQIQEFNPDTESIRVYLEWFKLFVVVNGIAEDKQASTLLLVMGLKHYSLVRGLVSPAKPEEKSLLELSALLFKHYDPKPIELFRGHMTLQLNARAIEAGVQVSPSSYDTLCCLWLFQALWTR